MYSKTFFWLIILVIGFGLILSGSILKPRRDLIVSEAVPTSTSVQNLLEGTVSPLPKSSPGPVFSPEKNISRTPYPQPSPGLIGSFPPATCNLSGEIIFISPNSYQNSNNFIEYKNIDHPARLIKWTVTPEDNVSIGPNLFTSFKIPDGKELITTTFASGPKYKEYILSASVTYGQWVNGVLRVFESQCSGQTVIKFF